MQLAGNVQVTHRLNPGLGAGRPRWTNLAIGKDLSSGELFLSCISNTSSFKYKILGNIEQVFMKFIERGLATIRFREPAHDYSINCKENVEGLKSFLNALRQVLQNKPMTVPLSALNPAGHVIQKAKTSLTIKERSAYPFHNGFPSSLEKLSLNLQMERFDRRIISLKNLMSLDLSDNRISELPKELGTLPHLVTLILSGNRLGQTTDEEATWSWMESSYMTSNLQHLDLTANDLQQLPASFNCLRSLKFLKLDNNQLTTLPQMIGTFRQLKYLCAGGNKLTHIPGSVSRLRLDYVDVSGNAFFQETEQPLIEEDAFSCPASLFEEAAKTILNKRLFYPKHLIPKLFQNYLNTAKVCVCGSACFESSLTVLSTIDLNDISSSLTVDLNVSVTRVSAEISFCSKKCIKYVKPTGVVRIPNRSNLSTASPSTIPRSSIQRPRNNNNNNNFRLGRIYSRMRQSTEPMDRDLMHQYRLH